MHASDHTLTFVHRCIQGLANAGIDTWLMGGWAEELWETIPPRPHGDIDLLYPAPDFQRLDLWLAHRNDLALLQGKFFHHKRAICYREVVIEIFLLEPSGDGRMTHFFGDKYAHLWPELTLCQLSRDGLTFPVASRQALQEYRQQHKQHYEAYLAHLRESARDLPHT